MTLHPLSALSAIWEWHDGSYDRVQFQPAETGWQISGRHGETRYVIGLTPDCTCTALEVSHDTVALTLNRTSGGWYDTGSGRLLDRGGVLDLDLGWSALTNTFPIRRLMAQKAETGWFDVLMITLPDLKPRLVRQRYTLTEDGWYYENKDSGFSALLKVDKYGLVTDYPGLCSRKDIA